VVEALQAELDRNITNLSLEDDNGPWFVGYHLFEADEIHASASLGSLLSERLEAPTGRLLITLALVLATLVPFYSFGLTPLIQSLVGAPLATRIVVAVAALSPLGICLGVFMPLGLRTISTLTSYGQEYVAWAWAINGFFSVLSSLFATILSMVVGFTAVMWIALAIYLVGIAALWRIGSLQSSGRYPARDVSLAEH
jgi:hypothetical protein